MEQISFFFCPTDKPLSAAHRSWGFPNDNELLWLLDQGVRDAALWPISGAPVRFCDPTFDLDHKGERALIFRAEDRGEVIDLIAWQPRTGAVASWRGQAFCLGDVDDIFNPASYFSGDALRLHATPLDWLLADREGIVIVRPDLAPAYLANSQRICCATKTHALQVEKWITPRKPTVEILVEVEEKGGGMSEKVTKLVLLQELPKEPRLVVKCAAEIKPEKIDWLWEQRLPLGKCVLVAGEGGLGKSMLLAWMAAAVSRGKDWPCDEGKSRCGSVIILSAEDDAADTIVPRLIAADADCSKVHILEAVHRDDDEGQRSFNLQLDLPELEKMMEQLDDVLLIIIDPITSYLGKVDSHKNADIRSVLEPLGKMAAKRHVTVIANTHLSKALGGSANSRVIGSVAFVNHARAAFIVTADPDDPGKRLFLPSKTNLGKPRNGLAYRIADVALPGSEHGSVIWAPYVQWEDTPVTISADQAMAALAGGPEGRSAIEEAKQFLLNVLSAGEEGQKEIKRQAEEAGFHWRTIRRAKDLLTVKAIREGGIGEKGRWVWRLMKKPKVSTSEFGHLSHLSHGDPPKMSKVSNVDAGHLSRCRLDAEVDERAAILEYDGGLAQAQADARAKAEFPNLPAFLDRRSVQ